QQFKIDLLRRLSFYSETSGGGMLMCRHPCDRIGQCDHRGTALVVDNVYQTGYASMYECRISHPCHCLYPEFSSPSLFHAMGHSDTGTHPYTCMQWLCRRQRTKSITAYIAGNGQLKLFKDMERPSVGAPRTHDGRPCWWLDIHIVY